MVESPMKRHLATEDLYSFKWVSDPQISPDGSRIAFVRTHIEDKKYRQSIFMVPAGGGEPERFTNGPKSDRSPRFSPDGRQLAFVSDRDGSNQIWVIDVEGGEARQVTQQKGGVSDISWSPDGRKIAFVGKWAPADDSPAEAKTDSDVRVVTRIKYKADGKGFWDGKWSHIYVADAETGSTTKITSGEYDHASPAWAPDSTHVAFVANRTGEADYTNVNDIWIASLESGELRQVTPSYGPCSNPSFSPCGRYIAYFGHDNKYRGATVTSVMVVPCQGGIPNQISLEYPVGAAAGSDMRYGDNPVKPIWTADGSGILFVASWQGISNVAQVTVADARFTWLTEGEHSVVGVSYSKTANTLALHIGDFTCPGDIWSCSLSTGSKQRLSRVNDDLLSQVALSVPEHIEYKAPDGWDIDGWVMKPVGFKEGVKYPAVLEIHGGPHSAYGVAFFLEFQMLAARGFGVIFTNPRGSESYGQKFVAATRLDWGGGDYNDIMAGLDYALTLGWIDENRLGVTGGSYGGYMTNWIIGKSNRFRAAVSCRSTCNRYSQFGNSDIGYNQGTFEFPGEPWDHLAFYMEHSPITYVKNVTTPVLLMQSENDYRCPISQAEEYFVALKLLRKTVELVRFPNEGHELSRSGQPVHRVERLNRMAGWFEKFIPVDRNEYISAE